MTEPKSMDIEQLMELLPHRYPFLLVDRVTEYVPGEYVKGYKNLTFNEPFFQGHFPDCPIMPGVLQIEALAQLCSAMVFTLPQYQGKLGVFAGIDKARFKRVVKPGDRLDMEATFTKAKGPLIMAPGKGFVNGQLAIDVDMMVSLVQKP